MSRTYALASASDAARELREEVGFFQAVRAAITKTTATGKLSQAGKTLAVQQLIDRSCGKTPAAAFQSPRQAIDTSAIALSSGST